MKAHQIKTNSSLDPILNLYSGGCSFTTIGKIGFINIEKVGTTYTSNIIFNNITKRYTKGKINKPNLGRDTGYTINLHESNYPEHVNFLNSSSEFSFQQFSKLIYGKKLYVLIRDPWTRLKTGIYETFNIHSYNVLGINIKTPQCPDVEQSLFSTFMSDHNNLYIAGSHINFYSSFLIEIIRGLNISCDIEIVNIDKYKDRLDNILHEHGLQLPYIPDNKQSVSKVFHSNKNYYTLVEDWIAKNPNHPTSRDVNLILRKEIAAFNIINHGYRDLLYTE